MIDLNQVENLAGQKLRIRQRALLREALFADGQWVPVTEEYTSADVTGIVRSRAARRLRDLGLITVERRKIGFMRRQCFKLTDLGVAYCRAFASQVIFGGKMKVGKFIAMQRRVHELRAVN